MKHVFMAAFCLFSALSYGQSKKFSFKLGESYELPRRSDDLAFFGNDQDGIVNLSLKKDELTIVRFNPKTLVQTSEKAIKLEEKTRNFLSEAVVNFGTNYYWIHSDWNKDEEKEILYYDKIDVVAGTLTEQNKKLFEAGKIAGVTASGGWFGSATKTYAKYDYNYSADHKRLLISYRLKPEKRNDKENYDKLGMYMIDENMQVIWHNEFTMPYTEAIMDNSDFSVDSQGNAYLLAKVYDSEKRKEKDKDGNPAYHYEVLKFQNGDKKIVSAKIAVDNYFIRESTLVESSNHDMIIACTYSKKSKGIGTDGVFLSMLDQSGKVVKYKNGYYEFPIEELTKFESARTKRKMEKNKDYEAPNLQVRNIVVGGDGSVFLTCEEFRIETNYQTNGRGSTYVTYTYYYEDIIAARINADGQFDWLRKIPKKQRSGRILGTMSFKLVADESGYYFLFLDNKKNMDLEEDEAPKYHQDGFGGQVVVAKLDKKGTLSKELLFDTREEEVMIFPSKFNRINSNQFIGRAVMKKNNNFEVLLITVN